MTHKLLHLKGMYREDKDTLYKFIKEVIDGTLKPKKATWGDNNTLIIDF